MTGVSVGFPTEEGKNDRGECRLRQIVWGDSYPLASKARRDPRGCARQDSWAGPRRLLLPSRGWYGTLKLTAHSLSTHNRMLRKRRSCGSRLRMVFDRCSRAIMHQLWRGTRLRYAITESTYLPGAWVVQAVDLPEGDYSSKAVFSGFEARQRAEAYAAEKNAALPAPPAKS